MVLTSGLGWLHWLPLDRGTARCRQVTASSLPAIASWQFGVGPRDPGISQPSTDVFYAHLRRAPVADQIRETAGCACAGNAGNVFPATDFKRKPLVNDPGVHHVTCVTHVSWCMSESITHSGVENVPVSWGIRNPQFFESDKRSLRRNKNCLNVFVPDRRDVKHRWLCCVNVRKHAESIFGIMLR